VREALADDLAAERTASTVEPAARDEIAVLEDRDAGLRWMEMARSLDARRRVVDDDAIGPLLGEGPVVFEGAQGVLLDEWRGLHPHTSWGTCTPGPARALLARHAFDGPIHTLGALRTYATRHGNGPLPTEAPQLLSRLSELHNAANEWQGSFRVGWLDVVLSRYAIEAAGGVDGLAVTHLDRLWAACRAAIAYTCGGHDDDLFARNGRGWVTALRLGQERDLARQARLGGALARVEPVIVGVPSDRDERFLEWIEGALGAPVWVTSSGATARAKKASFRAAQSLPTGTTQVAT
jgi:adenylosuccinate synthase